MTLSASLPTASRAFQAASTRSDQPPKRWGSTRPQARAVWKDLPLLLGAALAVRLIIALWSHRYSYADEIYQVLEQAHRLVYGHGLVPWEYRHGLRNWFLPGVVAGLMEILRRVGLDQPALYIPAIKSVFAVISLSLVVSCYVIGQNLFGERTARIAALIAAFWYENLLNTTLATPEVLATYALMAALALTTLPSAASLRRAAIIGVLLAITVALRVQYAVPVGLVWLYAIRTVGWRPALALSAAGLSTALAFGLLDAWTWGSPFASYIIAVRYNVLLGVAERFGVEPANWYLTALNLVSFGLYPAALLYGVICWRRCWLVLVIAAAVVVPHSLIAHKEYRFVVLAGPLLSIILADAIAHGLPRLARAFPSPTWPAPMWRAAGLGYVALVSLVGALSVGVMKRDPHFSALLDLAKRPQVGAVVDLTNSFATSGGYYYLHRDVPYYLPQHVRRMQPDTIRDYATHGLALATDPIPQGFQTVARYDTIVVIEAINNAPIRPLLPYDRQVAEPGIDGVTPSVTPRF